MYQRLAMAVLPEVFIFSCLRRTRGSRPPNGLIDREEGGSGHPRQHPYPDCGEERILVAVPLGHNIVPDKAHQVPMPSTWATIHRMLWSTKRKKMPARNTITNTMMVVTKTSRRLGHVTFATS